MRWLYLTSKTLRPSFSSLFALSVAREKHVMCLGPHWKPTPAVTNKKIQTILLSLSLAQQVNGYFSPILHIFPLFPSFLAFIFIGALVLYPVPSGAQEKETGILYPVSFCEEVRAGNIYGYSYRRSCKPCLSTVWFWRFSLCWVWVTWNIWDSIMQQLI